MTPQDALEPVDDTSMTSIGGTVLTDILAYQAGDKHVNKFLLESAGDLLVRDYFGLGLSKAACLVVQTQKVGCVTSGRPQNSRDWGQLQIASGERSARGDKVLRRQ